MNNSHPLLRLLILEDTENDVVLLTRQLKKAGYTLHYQQVQTEADFKQALTTETWDLIIADYTIPGFNGLAALRVLQATGQDIPFIIMSGAVGEDVAVEALKAGAHDFILKDRTARLIPAIQRELRDAKERAANQEIELKYRQAEERLRMALEAARICVWDWNLANDEIIYSDYYEDLFGTEPDSAIHTYEHFLQRLHPEDADRVTQAIVHSIQENTPLHLEYRIYWNDGSIHWLQLQGCGYHDQHGNVVNMTGTLQNITTRKRMQELEEEQHRMKAMYEKEMQLAKLRNRFMEMASHEFRTPLTVISSANELLYEYYDQLTPDKHKEYLSEISNRVRYMREMLTEIESVTRDEHVPMDYTPYPTNINTLVERVIKETQRESKNSHIIHFTNHGYEEYVFDGRLVGHILTHLLSNAVKFSKKNSEVHIILHHENDDVIMIQIVDSGIGIPQEDLDSVFDLFFRGSNVTTGGRGIGLKIVRDCVEAHQGSITIESKLKQGTTVTLRLPAQRL